MRPQQMQFSQKKTRFTFFHLHVFVISFKPNGPLPMQVEERKKGIKYRGEKRQKEDYLLVD